MQHAQPIYLVIGVPGCGKTWVCEQLKDMAFYIPHDLYYRDHESVIVDAALKQNKPIVTECPFGERVLIESLQKKRVVVHPFFVIEAPEVVKKRFEAREKRPAPQANLTRAVSIAQRAAEWGAPRGNSTQVLELLRNALERHQDRRKI